MKKNKMILCCIIILLLASCSSAGKYYEEGIMNLSIKNYGTAETYLKKAIDEGYTKDDVNVIYTIVSEYNNAKEYYDQGDYNSALTHIEKIPYSYSDYLIGIDIDTLKDKLEKYKEIDESISKAKKLLDSGEYEDANSIILMIDTQYATDEQIQESEKIKRQIKLEKKNNDYDVSKKIDALVDTYVHGLCQAVNTGDFRPLKGCLYENSSIYKEQESYISKMAKKEIYEYVNDYSVTNIEWESETTCIISTSETYDIFDGDTYRTETFRYTYEVIETSDKQLFLTSIKKSS